MSSIRSLSRTAHGVLARTGPCRPTGKNPVEWREDIEMKWQQSAEEAPREEELCAEVELPQTIGSGGLVMAGGDAGGDNDGRL